MDYMTNTDSKEKKNGEQKASGQGNFDATFDSPNIPELDVLADKYGKHRDARLVCGKLEVEARIELEEAMEENGLVGYAYTNKKGLALVVEIAPGVDKASVKPNPAARKQEAIEKGDE